MENENQNGESETDSFSTVRRSGPSRLGESLEAIRERILRGPVIDEAAEAERVAVNERARRESIWNAFIGNRERYRGATVDAWNVGDDAHASKRRRAIDGVADYLRSLADRKRLGEGAVFYGPVGTGKDMLAAIIARGVCFDLGEPVRHCNGAELFAELRRAIDGVSSEAEVLAKYSCVPWLVLSDPVPPFGAITDFQASALYRLMDARSARRKPTITTVNVADSREGAEKIGAPTWDRIRESAWVFECNWPSERRPAKYFGDAKAKGNT